MPDATILLAAASIDITAAADTSKGPRVSLVGYSGGAMRPPGWPMLVIDLDGLELPDQVPLLSDHHSDLAGIVGQAVPTVRHGKLVANGNIIVGSPAADRIVELAKGGLTFSASVGVEPIRTERVAAGESIAINNRTITTADEMTVVRAGRLREITITAVGADPDASVSIAASLLKGKSTMSTDATPSTPNFDPMLQFAWDNPALSASERVLARWQGASFADTTVRGRTEPFLHAALTGKIDFATFESHLLRAERDDAELRAMRAERPQHPGVYPSSRDTAGGAASNPLVLEAALLKHMGRESMGEKILGADVMTRGADLRCRSLVDIMASGLRMVGRDVPATADGIIKASFSTIDLSGILGSTANKVMLESYRAFPSVARLIAKRLTARDFKSHVGYRMTGDASFEEVGKAGEIKHGTLGESSYSYSIATFARMFSLSRQDILNDDLSAFAEVPQLIGRGAASKVESVFWTLVLANTGTFYAAGSGNYNDGAGSVLGIAGLGNAVTLMRQMVDAQGEPILVVPKYLVVPPELEATADQLFASTNVALVPEAAAAATVEMPDGNPYRGKYQPLVVPHLSNDAYSGYSATAWYLFGDAADVASFGLAYLNGQESPTIESSDADFNTLGMQWRGYLDFGVCQIDAKGSVKSAGA